MTKDRCNHDKVKCLSCGKEGTPAQLFASRSRPVSDKMKEQRKAAAQASAEKRKRRKEGEDET